MATATSTSTSTIPTMPRSAGRGRSTAAVCGRPRTRSHCCKVRAVATSPPRPNPCSAEGSSGKDYYKVLSLDHSASVGADDIKRAYRRLALRYHPDVCPPSRRAESTELFLELRRAYETLSDPAERVRYDAELRAIGDGVAAAEPGAEFVARDVWEAQLWALRARSEQRQRERRGGGGRGQPA